MLKIIRIKTYADFEREPIFQTQPLLKECRKLEIMYKTMHYKSNIRSLVTSSWILNVYIYLYRCIRTHNAL